MSALKEHHKVFIVTHLACFESPSEVAKAVKQEFGLDLVRQQVHYYNPATKEGNRMAPKLKALFAETRKQFLANVESIPIANKAVRVSILQRELDKALGRGNTAMVAKLLEQAASEVGGRYTNQHVTNVKGELNHHHDVRKFTNEQLVSELHKLGIEVEPLGGGARQADGTPVDNAVGKVH